MKNKHLNSFEWEVPEQGFYWITPHNFDQSGEDRWLSKVGTMRTRQQVRSYRPLEEFPALFRTFANIAPTEAGILAFANDYGLLQQPLPTDAPTQRENNTSRVWWAEQITQMQYAVTLWDAIRAKDLEIPERYKRVEEGENGPKIIPEEMSSEMIIDVQTMDYLSGSYNAPLGTLKRCIDYRLKHGATLSMIYEPEPDALSLQVIPHSLLDALWFQFARSIDEKRSYRRCLECGVWFEITAEGSRSSRFFHSDACRHKAYRERRVTAQRLFAEGTSIEDIAQQLESDAATIQRWVTAPKRQRKKRA